MVQRPAPSQGLEIPTRAGKQVGKSRGTGGKQVGQDPIDSVSRVLESVKHRCQVRRLPPQPPCAQETSVTRSRTRQHGHFPARLQRGAVWRTVGCRQYSVCARIRAGVGTSDTEIFPMREPFWRYFQSTGFKQVFEPSREQEQRRQRPSVGMLGRRFMHAAPRAALRVTLGAVLLCSTSSAFLSTPALPVSKVRPTPRGPTHSVRRQLESTPVSWRRRRTTPELISVK